MVPVCIRNQWSMALGLLVGTALWAGLSARAEGPCRQYSRPDPRADRRDAGRDPARRLCVRGVVRSDRRTCPDLGGFQGRETRNSIHDPADLDFRIWLAWHNEPARLYAAFVAADDSYWNTHIYDITLGVV